MAEKVSNVENDDRRQVIIPIKYERRSGIDRRAQERNDEQSCIFKGVAPVRRLISAKEEGESGNGLSALGYTSLALVNLPEDIRDIRNAWGQLTDKNFKLPYDYKTYQHTFSFFRGGLLEKMLQKLAVKYPQLVRKIIQTDITLAETTMGNNIFKKLGVGLAENPIETTIKDFYHTADTPCYVPAFNFEGSGKFKTFGEITARAMTRTTKLGILALAIIESPKVVKAMSQGETIGEQAKNTAKQTAKSTLNVASTTAGIAYGGAIGAKYGKGPLGSLIGMGVGAILGSKTSNIIDEIIA